MTSATNAKGDDVSNLAGLDACSSVGLHQSNGEISYSQGSTVDDEVNGTSPISSGRLGESPRGNRHPRAWEPKGVILGVRDSLGSGDSYLIADVLGEELNESAFTKVRDEVKWDVMHHRGGEVPRLVAVEGEVAEDGSFPVYRHPSDESPPLRPFSPTVQLIRAKVQQLISHPVNHVLIQHYRSGKDYISEHSDKTIDVVRGSSIVNVSLGAQRVMTLRTKKDAVSVIPVEREGTEASKSGRTTQRIPLPHGSMFVLGPETNRCWLHGINHDNRPVKVKTAEERQENGERISLTFRHIGTFLTEDQKRIYGQGAKQKVKEQAGEVVSGGEEAERMIEAFGRENHETTFDWDEWYGRGFDILHFTIKKAE